MASLCWLDKFLTSFQGPRGPACFSLHLHLGLLFTLGCSSCSFSSHLSIFKVPKHVKLFPSSEPVYMLVLLARMLFELLVSYHFLSLVKKTIPLILSRESLISFPLPQINPKLFFSTLTVCFTQYLPQNLIYLFLFILFCFSHFTINRGWEWKHNSFMHLTENLAHYVHTKNIYYVNE